MSEPVNDAEKYMMAAWSNLSAELHEACTPGIDVAKLIDAIDKYIVARVVLMKMDF